MSKRDIEIFLIQCKFAAESNFLLDMNEKNKETITNLGFIRDDVIQEILDLELNDYVEGPCIDRDGYGRDYYIFGKIIQNRDIYIKIKVKNLNEEGDRQITLLCKSFHFAEYPLTYPFK